MSAVRSVSIALLLFLGEICLGALEARGQVVNASISGLVTDRSGAVIDQASITAIRKETGARRTTNTGRSGTYELAGLLPGSYSLRVEKQGFNTAMVDGIHLSVGQELLQDIRLDVGSISQTVSVSGSREHVDTVDGAVSTVIDRGLIENMPLNGKDMQTLFELSPGTLLNAGGKASNGGGFSVDGQRPTANYLTIDGTSGNAFVAVPGSTNITGATIATSASGGTNGILPVDAIEEYRMDTSTYTAENGRTPGGQVQVRTRSGTNQFHGTVFEEFRNQVMDATDWFVKFSNITQSQLRMNEFGGTFGGPLVRNKLFFFAAHDTLELNQPTTSTNLVVPNQATRQSAAPVFQALLAAYPLGNGGPDASIPGFDFYNASFPFAVRNHTTSIRLDSNLPRSVHVFFRANLAPSSSTNVALNTLYGQSNIYTYTGGATVPISKNIIDELSVNQTTVTAYSGNSVGSTGGNDPNALKNNIPSGVNAATSTFGLFVGPSTTRVINQPALGDKLSQWNLIDSMTWQRARHTMKMGVDVLVKDTSVARPYNSYYVYLALKTATIPNLQTGVVDQVTYIGQKAQPEMSIKTTSIYINDAWRVTPAFVLNGGIRWEYNPAPSVGPLGVLALQGAFVDPSTFNAVVSNRPLYQNVYDNFAPRFGFAWTLSGQRRLATVLRGGVGTYFDTGQAATGAQAGISTYPYQSLSVSTTPGQYQSISWSGIAGTPGTLPQTPLYLIDPALASPRTYEWSLTLEQQLGRDTKLTTSYVGNDGEKLIGQASYYNKANTQGLYPVNTAIVSKNGYLYLTKNMAHSNYQALQMQFTSRLNERVNALVSYTWGHAEDNGSTEYTAVGALAPNPLANSAFDIRHAFAAAIHYAPQGLTHWSVARALTSGWAFDTIARLQTAPPTTVTYGSTTPTAFLANADLVPGQPTVLHESVNAIGKRVPGGKLLNFNAFTAPPIDSAGNPLRQGTSPTNAYRLFSLKQWDLAVSRSWHLWEGINMTFRVDAYNVLNIVNFAAPSSTWASTTASTFGMATNTYASTYGSVPSTYGQTGTQLAVFQNGGPRSIQLSLKAQF